MPQKKPEKTSQDAGRWVSRAMTAAIAVLGLGLVYALPLDRMPTACVMRRLTGVPCPTCGTGRALHALLHGHIRESLCYHPLLIPYLLAGGVLWLMDARARARGGELVNGRRLLWITLGAVALLAVVWLVRLQTGSIP